MLSVSTIPEGGTHKLHNSFQPFYTGRAPPGSRRTKPGRSVAPRTRYRPFQSGGRFAMNASIPSAASSSIMLHAMPSDASA